MAFTPISISRRHVLGELYSRCDSLKGTIPVYLQGENKRELLGHADEGLGHYADAFSFHLAEDICKKLSSGQYTYSFDYKPSGSATNSRRSRITLKSIILTGRAGYAKPIPRR